VRREDWRAGLITATISNILKGENDVMAQPLDFFPQHQKQKDTYESRRERRQREARELNARKQRALKEVEAKKETE
jgi:hypothetical protein